MFALKFKKKKATPEMDLCRALVKEIKALKAYGIIQNDFMLIRINVGSFLANKKERMRKDAMEKSVGAYAGASDFLAVWRDRITGIPKVLFLEAKVKGNYQQPNQKDFEREVKNAGFSYKIFHTTDEAISHFKGAGVFFKQVG